MKVPVRYCTDFGKGDCTDWSTYDFELLADEELAYNVAAKAGVPLNEHPDLREALGRAYWEIREAEEAVLIEVEDEYMLECQEEDESPFDNGWELIVEFQETDNN